MKESGAREIELRDWCEHCESPMNDNDSHEFTHKDWYNKTIFLCGKCADECEVDQILNQFWRRVL